MIEFNVLNRFTGKVQFVAKIDCGENAEKSIKLGLAVRWALNNGASLFYADLRGANLRGANLRGADLFDADLSCASLFDANLRDADLSSANLSGSNLSGANLRGADLRNADLCGADLSSANLSGSNLSGANLSGADLRDADLRGADLFDANLCGAVGEKTYIKTLQIECYPISYTSDILQIGCKIFLISEWWEFTDDQIAEMDGYKALEFWRKWKDWLRDLIEVRSPAEPTGYVEKKEGEVK